MLMLVPCCALLRCLCVFVQVAACASSTDIDIDIDIHSIDTIITANYGAEGAVSIRERAANEAALCVLCARMSSASGAVQRHRRKVSEV